MFRVPTPRKTVVAVAFERGNGKDRQGYDDISSPAYTDVARTGQNLHSLEESNITSLQDSADSSEVFSSNKSTRCTLIC